MPSSVQNDAEMSAAAFTATSGSFESRQSNHTPVNDTPASKNNSSAP